MPVPVTRPQHPATLRELARDGTWQSTTTGTCPGYLQTNMAILPAELATDFDEFCRANPQPMPLVERTEPGVPDRLACAPGADLRTDLPRYRVYRDGSCTGEPTDIAALWRDDLVAFLLGCSFSAEAALADAGVTMRHQELGQGVPMFRTSIDCAPAGRFHGPMVVSMRPIPRDQVDLAVDTTAQQPMAHGAPVHVGDPARIGIADLRRPDWGDVLEPAGDEVPVFWACGVTPQAAIAAVAPPLAITHAPGHMFVTDLLSATAADWG